MVNAIDQGEKSEADSGAQQPATSAAPAAIAAPDAGERIIGRLLRVGAVASGGLFLSSLVLEAAQPTWATPELLNGLRAAAASVLVGTPAVRLVVSGAWLASNREWRYAAAAFAVLVLMGLGMGLGWAA